MSFEIRQFLRIDRPGDRARRRAHHLERALSGVEAVHGISVAFVLSWWNSLGFMQISDRSRDLMKSGGEWISSVEKAIMAHPELVEAAVMAIPNERWSERPLAAIVKTRKSKLTAAEMTLWPGDKVLRYWLPGEIRFIDEVPTTPVGKFDKKVLRAL